MRRTNGSRNFGQEGNRRVWGSENHDRSRQTERLQGRSSRDGREGSYKTGEYNDRNTQGYSGRFEDEDRWQHYNLSDENERNENESPDYFGPRGMSEKSREWQYKGVYSTINEDDVRDELDYRFNSNGTGSFGRGSDYMDEDHRWRMAGSERSQRMNNNEGRSDDRSWRANIRTGKRRRITHD
jgi:hypothetical protein